VIKTLNWPINNTGKWNKIETWEEKKAGENVLSKD
jgi:hypothetical protein